MTEKAKDTASTPKAAAHKDEHKHDATSGAKGLTKTEKYDHSGEDQRRK